MCELVEPLGLSQPTVSHHLKKLLEVGLVEREQRGKWVDFSGLEAAGLDQISVEFTHQVADGMHGAIVKAVKTSEPATRGLPMIQAALSAGCC